MLEVYLPSSPIGELIESQRKPNVVRVMVAARLIVTYYTISKFTHHQLSIASPEPCAAARLGQRTQTGELLAPTDPTLAHFSD
jgi:hypothetical protein